MFEVVTEDCCEYLDIIAEMFVEHRAEPAVDHPRHEDEVISGTAFTLAKARTGDFAGGIPGFMLGLKTYTRVTDNIGVGLYYQYGLSMALTGIKYLSSSGSNAWMDAAISFSQFGGTVYF